MSSREFNQDVARAKRAAADGPVVITDRGEPAFVLMTIDEFRSRDLTGPDLVDLLAMDDEMDVEFNFAGQTPSLRDFEL